MKVLRYNSAVALCLDEHSAPWRSPLNHHLACFGGGGGKSDSETNSNPVTASDKGTVQTGTAETTVGEGSIGVGSGGKYMEAGSTDVGGNVSSNDSHAVTDTLTDSGNDSHAVTDTVTDSGNTDNHAVTNITTSDDGAISVAGALAGQVVGDQTSAFKDSLATLAALAGQQSDSGSTLFAQESSDLRAMIQAQADASAKDTNSVNSLVSGVLGSLKDTTATAAAGPQADQNATLTKLGLGLFALLALGFWAFSSKSK